LQSNLLLLKCNSNCNKLLLNNVTSNSNKLLFSRSNL